jgi:hypothetical protein
MLFLDDERQAPTSDLMDMEVVSVKTVREFIETVTERGCPSIISFDWYLGTGQPTGLDAARWLIEYDKVSDVISPDFMFESQSLNKDKAKEIVKELALYITGKFRVKGLEVPRQLAPHPSRARTASRYVR